jgi:hypothetical protein
MVGVAEAAVDDPGVRDGLGVSVGNIVPFAATGLVPSVGDGVAVAVAAPADCGAAVFVTSGIAVAVTVEINCAAAVAVASSGRIVGSTSCVPVGVTAAGVSVVIGAVG